MTIRPTADEPRAQCAEHVYVRDTYRVWNQGGRHFKMHYDRQQCSRKAQPGRDYCWQHPWADPQYLKMKKP